MCNSTPEQDSSVESTDETIPPARVGEQDGGSDRKDGHGSDRKDGGDEHAGDDDCAAPFGVFVVEGPDDVPTRIY